VHFGRYSYGVTILVCAGGPLLLEYLLMSGLGRHYRRLLSALTLTMVVAAWIWDAAGMAWRLWSYAPTRTLGMSLGGVPIETFIVTILAAPAVAIATLAWADLPLNPMEEGRVMPDFPTRGAAGHQSGR
jgi:lycopene cyclase domain-containing protein